MKKAAIIIVLALAVSLCLFALTGNYEFKYKLTRTTTVGVTWIFTDSSGNRITAQAIDLSKGLTEPQIQLVISTNKTDPYNITLTFNALTPDGASGSSFLGHYKARISDIYDTPSVRNVVFASSSSESVSTTFPGDTSNYAGTTISQAYPIAFDFSDYIDSYETGTFSGTIVVEVTPVE